MVFGAIIIIFGGAYFGTGLLFTNLFSIWFTERVAVTAALLPTLIFTIGTFFFLIGPYGAPKVKRLYAYLAGEQKHCNCSS